MFNCIFDRFVGRAGEPERLMIDATYLKVRQGGRIVSVAAIIAMAVDTDGRREIIGLCVGPSEADWTEFLRSLKSRGLQGVKLVISDAHAGLVKAIGRCFQGAAWQRCRVHAMRNLLSAAPHRQRAMIAALVRTVFAQPDAATARAQLRAVVDQLTPLERPPP